VLFASPRPRRGVDPPATRQAAEPAPAALPARLVLPLQASAGDASQPLVAAGQRVLPGRPLSRAAGLLSRPRLSPVAARVAAVERRPVQAPPLGDGDPGGPATVLCAVLDELERPAAEPGSQAWRGLEPDARAERFAAAGLEGVEGLPLDLELELLPAGARLVVGLAETETGSGAFDWILRERGAELEAALEALAESGRFREAVLVH